jgi:hypothetical protein
VVRRARSSLLGLDLSATAAAAVAVPLDWDGDWQRVRWTLVGEPLLKGASDEDRARRTERIARKIVRFAHEHRAFAAWIESYAFSMRTMAHTLGEVGGVVRLELVREGLAVHTANMSTSRKLLLGGLPPRGSPVSAKQEAARVLASAGAPIAWVEQKGLDLVDAFTAVNLALSFEPGAYCFAQEPPPKRKGKAA